MLLLDKDGRGLNPADIECVALSIVDTRVFGDLVNKAIQSNKDKELVAEETFEFQYTRKPSEGGGLGRVILQKLWFRKKRVP